MSSLKAPEQILVISSEGEVVGFVPIAALRHIERRVAPEREGRLLRMRLAKGEDLQDADREQILVVTCSCGKVPNPGGPIVRSRAGQVDEETLLQIRRVLEARDSEVKLLLLIAHADCSEVPLQGAELSKRIIGVDEEVGDASAEIGAHLGTATKSIESCPEIAAVLSGGLVICLAVFVSEHQEITLFQDQHDLMLTATLFDPVPAAALLH